jgi:CIC family chloride channel protein
MSAWRAFTGWFNRLELSENAVLLAFGLAVGGLSALGVIAFYTLIDGAYALFFSATSGGLGGVGTGILRPLLTGVAIAGAWWIMSRPGRGHEGLNIPDVQLAVARRGGHIPAPPALARAAASAVTIGGGGSAGSEGPVAVLGSTAGSFLGRAFGFGPSRVRILVAAGAAGGISAAFNAPLAGAFFALEQILGSLAVEAFAPVVVSSVTAGVVSHSVFGDSPAFAVPLSLGPPGGLEVLAFFPILGVTAALVGVLFVRTYSRTQDVVERSRLHPALVAGVGGVVIGGLVMLSGGRLVGSGHLSFPLALFGGLAWWVLLLLAAGKILVTSLTLSVGGSGGIFTPCLYVGAATGSAFGEGLARLFPGLGVNPGVYGLVAMGAVVVSATDAPLTAVLLIFEITGEYSIVLPLMITTVIAHVAARRLEPDSVYRGWLRRKGQNIDRGTDRDVLTRIRVRDVYDPDPKVIGEGASVDELLDNLEWGVQSDFPVVDAELRVSGVIAVSELGRLARDRAEFSGVLLAADIANPVTPVTLDDPVLTAVARMGTRGVSSLPVIDEATGRLRGMIGRDRILAAYETAVAEEGGAGRGGGS